MKLMIDIGESSGCLETMIMSDKSEILNRAERLEYDCSLAVLYDDMNAGTFIGISSENKIGIEVDAGGSNNYDYVGSSLRQGGILVLVILVY